MGVLLKVNLEESVELMVLDEKEISEQQYAGHNFIDLNISSEKSDTTPGIGWLLGVSYKRINSFMV